MQVRMSFLVEFDAAAWATEYGTHPLDNPEDVLSYFRQYFQGSPASEASKMEIISDKLTIVKAGPKPTSRKSTDAALNFLLQDDPYKQGHGPGWYRFHALDRRDLESFRKSGIPYFRDKSEFQGSTIDTIDWAQLYEWIKNSE